MEVTRKEQEFNQTDWYGYSGAISKNNQQPLIIEFTDEDNDENVINLTISYDSPDENDDKCSVQMDIYEGEKNSAYICMCYNWDVAYELFKAVQKDLSKQSFKDVIKTFERKGFERAF